MLELDFLNPTEKYLSLSSSSDQKVCEVLPVQDNPGNDLRLDAYMNMYNVQVHVFMYIYYSYI